MIDPRVEDALRRGRPAFNIQGISGTALAGVTLSDALANVDCEIPVRWLVNLNAFRYRSRPGVVDLTTVPLSTVDTALPAADNQIESVVPNYHAILEYGYGGVFETVTLDWPMRGATVAVTASSIRLKASTTGLSAGFALARGNMSGFIAPSDVSRDSIVTPPIFTPNSKQLNIGPAGGSAFFDIPPRAIGFRLWMPGSLTTYYSIGQNLYQTDGQGNRLVATAFNVHGTSAPAMAPSSGLASNMYNWYPVFDAAQEIEVNTTSTTTQSAVVQFLLDIG